MYGFYCSPTLVFLRDLIGQFVLEDRLPEDSKPHKFSLGASYNFLEKIFFVLHTVTVVQKGPEHNVHAEFLYMLQAIQYHIDSSE